MTNERREFLHTLDRSFNIECALDENAFLIALKLVNGEGQLLKLEFTKGFALELKAFLDEHLTDE